MGQGLLVIKHRTEIAHYGAEAVVGIIIVWAEDEGRHYGWQHRLR
jgi:hypothetical protein